MEMSTLPLASARSHVALQAGRGWRVAQALRSRLLRVRRAMSPGSHLLLRDQLVDVVLDRGPLAAAGERR